MKKIVNIKFGSHLYGTATDQSDLDLKSVFIPSDRDILLGKAKGSICNKTIKKEGEKNIAGEIDEESYSLQRYLQLLSEGQTVALDMLFAPSESFIDPPSKEWFIIVDNRHKLISRKSTAFVGYCRQQANKYGIKGSRVAAVRKALELLNDEVPQAPLTFIWKDIEAITEETEHLDIVEIEQPGGKTLAHWEICGRKFSKTITIKFVRECLQKIMDNYGQRALAAEAQNGVDWKALSHAVRVAKQAIELLNTGHVTLPLPYAVHILDIKQGKLEYQKVADEIESLLEVIELASKQSTLPDHPDYEFIDDLIENIYRDTVVNCFNH